MSLLVLLSILAVALISSSVYIVIPLFFLLTVSIGGGKDRTSPKIPKAFFTIFLGIAVTFAASIANDPSNDGIMLSLRGSARYVCYIIFFIALSTLSQKTLAKSLQRLTIILGLALPFNTYLSLSEAITGSVRYEFIFEHPNHFAYFLVPLFIFHLTAEQSRWQRAFGIIIICLSLVLAKSSGALITVIAIAALHFSKNLRVFTYGVVLIIILSMLLATSGFHQKIFDQFSALSVYDLTLKIDDENFGGSGSFAWRIIYWSTIWNYLLAGNFVSLTTGLGYGSMSFGSYVLPFMYTDPHNDFLKTLGENGVLGLSLIFASFSYLALSKITNRGLLLLGFLIPMFFGNVLTNASFIMLMGTVCYLQIKRPLV